MSNVVCTAWPVEDDLARTFARELYGALIGGPRDGGAAPLPMYLAMREARLAITGSAGAGQTWGAYQHYGDPYFRLFGDRLRTRRRAL